MMNARPYQWHARRVFFFDRINQRRYEASGFVLAWSFPAHSEANLPVHFTGLGYHSQDRDRELPPMYVHNETQLGAHGSYYPVHIPSGQHLVHAVWSSEETIRWFLQRLVDEEPRPGFWSQEAYPEILDPFPDVRSAMIQLEHFSVCQEITRQRRHEDHRQGVHQLNSLCKVAAKDQRLDEEVRRSFLDLTRCFDTGSTWEESVQHLEKWTLNGERAAAGLMPPYCATMAQRAGIYRQLLTILRWEVDVVAL